MSFLNYCKIFAKISRNFNGNFAKSFCENLWIYFREIQINFVNISCFAKFWKCCFAATLSLSNIQIPGSFNWSALWGCYSVFYFYSNQLRKYCILSQFISYIKSIWKLVINFILNINNYGSFINWLSCFYMFLYVMITQTDIVF